MTSTAPVAALYVSWVGTVNPGATLRIEFAIVAGAPLIVSPVRTFTTFSAPEAPFTLPTVSAVATTGETSVVIEIVAILQLVGFSFSQIL